MRRAPQIKWGPTDGERVQFLRDHYPSMTLRKLTSAFCKRFAVDVTESAIGFQLNRHRILKDPPKPATDVASAN